MNLSSISRIREKCREIQIGVGISALAEQGGGGGGCAPPPPPCHPFFTENEIMPK